MAFPATDPMSPVRPNWAPSLEHWYRHGPLAAFVASRHVSGFGSTLTDVVQPAGDMSDPGYPELSLGVVMPGFASTRSHVRSEVARCTVAVSSGQVFCPAPNVAHDIVVEGPHRLVIWSLPVSQAHRLLAEAAGTPPADLGHLHSGAWNDPFVSGSILQLQAWALTGATSLQVAADAMVVALLHHLLHASRSGPRSRSPRPQPPRGGLTRWQVQRVVERVQADLSAPISLKEMADSAGLSPFHFCRAFKTTLGLSPGRWISEQRQLRARELLLGTALGVAEVAAAVGYEDPAYFARQFRARWGRSPSECRRESAGC